MICGSHRAIKLPGSSSSSSSPPHPTRHLCNYHEISIEPLALFQLPIDPRSQPLAVHCGLADELRSIEETCRRHLAADLITPPTGSEKSFGRGRPAGDLSSSLLRLNIIFNERSLKFPCLLSSDSRKKANFFFL